MSQGISTAGSVDRLDKNVFDLTGKVAIVTGGSRGLGRAFCETLAKYGADIVCV